MNTDRRKRRKVLHCIRCGRRLYHYHYLYSEYEEGYVCADDRLCRRPVITRKLKKLELLKERWAE
ncbi:MAG: hypothetical protein DBY32_01110 [Phascolarctobacterium sp.]|nr:MAG: hypothetical protein DBY32_01110 [Phascolarctobacterium sp.]